MEWRQISLRYLSQIKANVRTLGINKLRYKHHSIAYVYGSKILIIQLDTIFRAENMRTCPLHSHDQTSSIGLHESLLSTHLSLKHSVDTLEINLLYKLSFSFILKAIYITSIIPAAWRYAIYVCVFLNKAFHFFKSLFLQPMSQLCPFKWGSEYNEHSTRLGDKRRDLELC